MSDAEAKFLLDPYLDWARREGIPIAEGAAVDLNTVELASWLRIGPGCRGAFVHLRGRGDFVALVNPDAFLTAAYLSRIIEAFDRAGESFGAATGKLLRGRGYDIEPTEEVDSMGIRMTRSGRHLDMDRLPVASYRLPEKSSGNRERGEHHGRDHRGAAPPLPPTTPSGAGYVGCIDDCHQNRALFASWRAGRTSLG